MGIKRFNMTLDSILAISGKPGLYQLKTKTRNGFAAVSLTDGKPVTIVTGRNEVSILSETAIYTSQDELPLREVFQRIKTREKGGKTPVTNKDGADVLETYFAQLVPDYDTGRVFPNHIRKIIHWYNTLQDKEVSFEVEAEPTKETASG